jgi:hypothetical protein
VKRVQRASRRLEGRVRRGRRGRGRRIAIAIGADTALDDFAVACLPRYARCIAKHIVRPAWLDPIQIAYSRLAMVDRAKGAHHRAAAELYRDGTNAPPLAAYAHDFVIPSASQALYALDPKKAPETFLGNVVNPRGTHVSGGDERDGDSDMPFVHAVLRDLGKGLV